MWTAAGRAARARSLPASSSSRVPVHAGGRGAVVEELVVPGDLEGFVLCHCDVAVGPGGVGRIGEREHRVGERVGGVGHGIRVVRKRGGRQVVARHELGVVVGERRAARQHPERADGGRAGFTSAKRYLAASVRSWMPWIPCRTPWLALVPTCGTWAMMFSRSAARSWPTRRWSGW